MARQQQQVEEAREGGLRVALPSSQPSLSVSFSAACSYASSTFCFLAPLSETELKSLRDPRGTLFFLAEEAKTALSRLRRRVQRGFSRPMRHECGELVIHAHTYTRTLNNDGRGVSVCVCVCVR